LAYIICEPCVGTKDTACVDVCPVDCIHPRKDEAGFDAAEMLYIHPLECIDCGACVPACPVEAIFAQDETPARWKAFVGVNAAYYRGSGLRSLVSGRPSPVFGEDTVADRD
jgi:NAD-dependent dihydropyrimidine dehydrogenase PreA subunit